MERVKISATGGRVPTYLPLVAMLLALGAGCRPASPGPAASEADSTSTNRESAPSAAQSTSELSPEGSASESPEVTLSTPKLPGDVFFERPLAIAAGRARLPEPSPAQMASSQQESPEESTQSAAKSDGPNWAKLLPAKLLNAEMLHVRDSLTPKLAEVASYNKSMMDLPPYLAEMAALAIVAGKHSEKTPWSEEAKYIRSLAAAAGLGKLKRGPDSYKKVKVPFEKISKLLSGKRPEELPDAPEKGSFMLSVNFKSLMKRLQIGRSNLRLKGSSQKTLSKNKSDVVREAHVMATLGAIIATDDYGYGKDDVYQEFARHLRTHALEAASAAKNGKFDAYLKALNQMAQSCNQCHNVYR